MDDVVGPLLIPEMGHIGKADVIVTVFLLRDRDFNIVDKDFLGGGGIVVIFSGLVRHSAA